jgi:hypothetical protein
MSEELHFHLQQSPKITSGDDVTKASVDSTNTTNSAEDDDNVDDFDESMLFSPLFFINKNMFRFTTVLHFTRFSYELETKVPIVTSIKRFFWKNLQYFIIIGAVNSIFALIAIFSFFYVDDWRELDWKVCKLDFF